MFDLVPFRTSSRGLFDIFDDFEKRFLDTGFTSVKQFRTDVVDKGESFLLQAELPGFSKEDIQICLSDNYLTISAKRNEEKKESDHNYIRQERRYGEFSRSFDLTGIDTESISASYENGVLNLELPKVKEAPVPPVKQIEIK